MKTTQQQIVVDYVLPSVSPASRLRTTTLVSGLFDSSDVTDEVAALAALAERARRLGLRNGTARRVDVSVKSTLGYDTKAVRRVYAARRSERKRN
jgi:uncharacterized protein (UPF0335 family)